MTEDELRSIQARLQRLEDREGIREVELRYMRGFDRNDEELLRGAFWPDVQISYGDQVNTLDEFIERHLHQHVRDLARYGHLLTNFTIDLDGDVAHCESYVTAFWQQKPEGPVHAGGATIASVRYIDRLDRRGGEWRIAVREAVGNFMGRTLPPDLPVTASSVDEVDPTWWDRRDPSYRRPLLRRPD